jgi:hypothetical protein
MTTSIYHRVLYVPFVLLLLGWALFATVAQAKPPQPAFSPYAWDYPTEPAQPRSGLTELETALPEAQAEAVESEVETAESQPYEFADADARQEATQLLNEVKSLANKLTYDAELLKSYAQNHGMSWHSHAAQLNLIREHVNAMGERLDRLQQIQPSAAAWQQQAIDRIHPVALELADHIESAIQHVNEHQGYLFSPDYKNHVASAHDLALELTDHAGSFLAYADAQQRVHHLEEKLGII